MVIAGSRAATVATAAPDPTIADVLRSLAWYVLLGLVFVVPLAMSNWTLRGSQFPIVLSHDVFDTIKVLVQRVMTTVALVAWASSVLLRGGTLRWTTVTWLVIAFLVWITLSAALSIHPATGFFGSYRRYEGVFSFINYAVIFLLASQLVDGRRRQRQLAAAVFGSAVLVSGYGVAQFLGADPIAWAPLLNQRRSFSTYGNPVLLAGYLALVLPVAVALAFTTRSASLRVACWAGIVLITWCWIVTFARGAWIGGLLGLAILGVGLFACHRVKLQFVDAAAAALIVLMSLGVAAKSMGSTDEITNVVKRVQSMASRDDGSTKTRSQILQAARAAIGERPVIGYGPDTFRLVFPKYKPAEYVRGIGHLAVADNAHNYPMQLAVGVGIPGAMLLYAVFMWVALRSAKLAFPRSRAASSGAPAYDGVLLLGFWAAGAGYVTSLFFGISVTGSTILQWVLMGAVLAPSATVLRVRAPSWGTAGALVACLSGLALIVFWSVWFYADRETLNAHTAPDVRARIAAAHSAMRLNPYNSEYRTNVGLVYKDVFARALRQGGEAEAASQDPRPYRDVAFRALDDAARALRSAIEYTPDEYDNYVALSNLYNLAGNAFRRQEHFAKAIDAAQQGIKVVPLGPALRYELAWAYAQTGRVSGAIEELEFAHSLDPAFVDCALGLASLYAAQGQYDRALAVLNRTVPRGADAGRITDLISAIEARRISNTTATSP